MMNYTLVMRTLKSRQVASRLSQPGEMKNRFPVVSNIKIDNNSELKIVSISLAVPAEYGMPGGL